LKSYWIDESVFARNDLITIFILASVKLLCKFDFRKINYFNRWQLNRTRSYGNFSWFIHRIAKSLSDWTIVITVLMNSNCCFAECLHDVFVDCWWGMIVWRRSISIPNSHSIITVASCWSANKECLRRIECL
jgi:hypothetical protein